MRMPFAALEGPDELAGARVGHDGDRRATARRDVIDAGGCWSMKQAGLAGEACR